MMIFWNKLTFLSLAVVVCAVGLLMEAALALFLGMLLVVFALQKLPDAPAFPTASTDALLLYSALFISLAGSGLAAWLSAQHDFRFATLDVALWLASILLIAAAAVWHDRRCRVQHLVRAEHNGPSSRNRFLELGFVLLTTLIALGLRIYDLTTLPPMVHGDEGEVGMLVLQILEEQEPLSVFAATVFGQNPAGFPYLIAPFLAIFGRNEVGLRVLPALAGTASVPLLYLIGRSGWGLLAGASAAWLMAVSHLHIHYSRIAVPNIGNSFVVVLMIWLLFWAYKRNVTFLEKLPAPEGNPAPSRPWFDGPWLNVPLAAFVGVGLLIGLGQYIYHGARLLPIIAGLALLFQLRARKITYLQIAVVGFAALVAVAPLAIYYLAHWQEFIGRSETVFIFREENLKHVMGADATFANDLLPYLSHQFVATLGLFTGDGDRSSFYLLDIPAFDPVTLILLWLGLGVLLTRLRRFEESVIAIWLLLGMLFAGFLTIDQPNGPRVISVVPAIYLIGGIFVQHVWRLLPAVTREHSRWKAALALVGVALVLLFLNWRTYFVDLKSYTLPILSTAVAHAVAATPDAAAVYIMGDPVLYAEHGTIRFLAGTDNIFDLKTPAELPALNMPLNMNSAGALVVVLEHRLDDLQAIKEQYPDGEYRPYSDLQGRFLFATYYLP